MSFSFNPLTGELDLMGVGGAASVPYAQVFTSASFTGPTSGNYTLSILASTHGKGINPSIQILEQSGVEYESILVNYKVDASGNIVLYVNEIPDLRFNGKIIIL